MAAARRRRLGCRRRDDAHARPDRRPQHARPGGLCERRVSPSRASGAPPSEPARRSSWSVGRGPACVRSRSGRARTCCRSSTGRCSPTPSSICAGTACAARSCPVATCRPRSATTSATRTASLALELRGRGRAARNAEGRSGSPRAASARRSSRSTATRCARRISARCSSSIGRRGAKATILLTPVSDPSRYGLVRLGADGQSRVVPREAEARGDRHEPDQRRPLRARAERARADPRGPGGLDRAGGLPAALRRGIGVRALAARILARRRHPRVVPAGAPRRARAAVPDRGRRRARRATTRSSPHTAVVHPDARLVPPVYIGANARDRRRRTVSAASRSIGAGAVGRGGSGRRVVRGRTRGDRRRTARPSSDRSSARARVLGEGCRALGLSVVGPGRHARGREHARPRARARRRRRDAGGAR